MSKNKLSISTGNSKIGKTLNISMTPIESCGNSEHCQDKCYCNKAYRQYLNVRKAWGGNFELAMSNRSEYFGGIYSRLERYKGEYFRWHVSGDILDNPYLLDMMFIADCYKDKKFLCFTKMHDILNEVLVAFPKPENLSLYLSAWPGMELENPHDLPVAWLQDGTETRMVGDPFECPGLCEDCRHCWESGDDVVFGLH